jgi:hypothetical protein
MGETCNLIMADQIKSIDAITEILSILAKFRYGRNTDFKEGPDAIFMQKIEKIYLGEPVLSQQVACKIMWNLWAIGYESKEVMTHASKFITKGH